VCALGRVELLGVQAEVVRDAQQPLEKLLCVLAPAGEGERLHHPEGAGQEHTLRLTDAVDRRVCGVVSHHEAVVGQADADCVDRRHDPRVVAG
jgi:hypothetical protein